MKPDVPAHLKGVACTAYDDMCLALTKAGTIDETDAAVIEVYAVTYAAWRAACDDIAENGMKTMGHRGLVKNPACTIRDTTCTQLRSLLKELGLTPSARRLAGRTPLDDDPFAAFLAAREQTASPRVA